MMNIEACRRALDLDSKRSDAFGELRNIHSKGFVTLSSGRRFKMGSAVYAAVVDALVEDVADLGLEIVNLGVMHSVSDARPVDPPVLPQAHGTA